MSAATEIPWTQTVVLNAQDHPFIAYLEQNDEGTGWRWAFQAADHVVGDPEYLSKVLWSLHQYLERAAARHR